MKNLQEHVPVYKTLPVEPYEVELNRFSLLFIHSGHHAMPYTPAHAHQDTSGVVDLWQNMVPPSCRVVGRHSNNNHSDNYNL